MTPVQNSWYNCDTMSFSTVNGEQVLNQIFVVPILRKSTSLAMSPRNHSDGTSIMTPIFHRIIERNFSARSDSFACTTSAFRPAHFF